MSVYILMSFWSQDVIYSKIGLHSIPILTGEIVLYLIMKYAGGRHMLYIYNAQYAERSFPAWNEGLGEQKIYKRENGVVCVYVVLHGKLQWQPYGSAADKTIVVFDHAAAISKITIREAPPLIADCYIHCMCIQGYYKIV